MPLVAVVAHPTLDAADRRWVESIRGRHDPHATRVAAHFTLVFPVDADDSAVAAEAAAAARATGPIPFVIRSAKAVRDLSGPGGHVFLVPAEGADEIGRLHDRLYGGVLRRHLRDDLPFEPHITVAADANFGRCEAIAEELNRERPIVGGTLERLELLDVSRSTIVSIGQFPFGQNQS